MIKIHKDVLDYLGIEHTFLTGARNGFCVLLEAGTAGRWVIAVDGSWEEGEAVLNVKYKEFYLTWPVEIKKKDHFSYYLDMKDNGFKESPLFEGIKNLEKDEALWNKRKEKRYNIGADLSAVLGLRKAEQRVILGGDLNRELPCMVNDASMGGIRFTTFDSGDIKKGDSAAVLLDFSDPIERITLKGIIQAVIIKSGEQKNTGASGGMPAKFAIISLKFQDDPPLSYKRRLKAFVENNKENK